MTNDNSEKLKTEKKTLITELHEVVDKLELVQQKLDLAELKGDLPTLEIVRANGTDIPFKLGEPVPGKAWLWAKNSYWQGLKDSYLRKDKKGVCGKIMWNWIHASKCYEAEDFKLVKYDGNRFWIPR